MLAVAAETLTPFHQLNIKEDNVTVGIPFLVANTTTGYVYAAVVSSYFTHNM